MAWLPATSETVMMGVTELGEIVGLGAVTTVWASSWSATNAVTTKAILFILNVMDLFERLPAAFGRLIIKPTPLRTVLLWGMQPIFMSSQVP